MTKQTQEELIGIAIEAATKLWGKPTKITKDYAVFGNKRVPYNKMQKVLAEVLKELK